MIRNRRQWVIGILFWIVFLASIWLGLEGRYEWIDKAWAFVRLGILAAVSILMVVALNRARKGPREYFFDRGVPRLVAAFFMDDEDLEKRRIKFRTCARTDTSSFDTASSATINFGRIPIARAIATR